MSPPDRNVELDLETRIRRLEIRAELTDLVARYCAAVDDRDFDALLDLFCVDGSFGHVGGEPATGHAELLAYYRRRLEGVGASFHYPHTHLLTKWGDDEIEGVVSAHAEMGIGPQMIVAAMRYHDTYRLVDGSWRFGQRRLRFWYIMPADELPASLGHPLRKRWPGPPSEADLPESLDTYHRQATVR